MSNKDITVPDLDENLMPVMYGNSSSYTAKPPWIALPFSMAALAAGVVMVAIPDSLYLEFPIFITSFMLFASDSATRYHWIKKIIGKNRVVEDSENDLALYGYSFVLSPLFSFFRGTKHKGFTLELDDGTVISLKAKRMQIQIEEKATVTAGELWDNNFRAFDPSAP